MDHEPAVPPCSPAGAYAQLIARLDDNDTGPQSPIAKLRSKVLMAKKNLRKQKCIGRALLTSPNLPKMLPVYLLLHKRNAPYPLVPGPIRSTTIRRSPAYVRHWCMLVGSEVLHLLIQDDEMTCERKRWNDFRQGDWVYAGYLGLTTFGEEEVAVTGTSSLARLRSALVDCDRR